MRKDNFKEAFDLLKHRQHLVDETKKIQCSKSIKISCYGDDERLDVYDIQDLTNITPSQSSDCLFKDICEVLISHLKNQIVKIDERLEKL